MRIWTDAAKAAQRAAIRRWQPWAKSTGPRTQAGKDRASLNARKHGQTPVAATRAFNAALRAHANCRKAFEEYWRWKRTKNSVKRTIMMVVLQALMRRLDREFFSKMYEAWDIEEAWNEADEAFQTPDLRMAA